MVRWKLQGPSTWCHQAGIGKHLGQPCGQMSLPQQWRVLVTWVICKKSQVGKIASPHNSWRWQKRSLWEVKALCPIFMIYEKGSVSSLPSRWHWAMLRDPTWGEIWLMHLYLPAPWLSEPTPHPALPLPSMGDMGVFGVWVSWSVFAFCLKARWTALDFPH